MNALVKITPNIKKFNDYIFEVKKGTTPIMLSGLTDARKSTFSLFNKILFRKANLYSYI